MMQQNAFAADFRLRCNHIILAARAAKGTTPWSWANPCGPTSPETTKTITTATPTVSPTRAGWYWASSARTGTPPVSLKEPAAILCAVVSLLTHRLCRSDTAVSVNVDGFTDLLFGVGLLAVKAQAARAAVLTRLVLATQDREALSAADTDGVTAVFVGTGRQLLA
ncbi:hypothetical protein niasHS_000748 [Heterodera schachtii]|uniref:Uncharacterized protein n=1 Tax=Heterodera schachtii TaxID=97005 RepID=A0ABD2KKU7_HETSC